MKRFLLGACILSFGNLAWGQTAPPLGAARDFAVLGATTVTNAGPTVITGDLGVSPGTSITGFPPGTVTAGTIHAGDSFAATAQANANTAYSDLVADTCGTNLSGLDLGTDPGAITLLPGVYCFNAGARLTGTLTLNGSGVYIFQIGTTLATTANSSVVLENGATAANVFWQIGSSASLGVDTTFVGSIFALTNDTALAGASVEGRVIALNGQVTLDDNAITSTGGTISGRWEIVDTTGDSSAQTALYPASFSTSLKRDGTGYTYGSFSDSICVVDVEHTNVVPSWVALGGNEFQITITVDNLGLAPDFSVIYTGTFDRLTPVPSSNPPLFTAAITGTYATVGGSPTCSNGPGNFVATFLPTIVSGSASGSLDDFAADNGSPFDAPVNATITFTAPPASGQIAGTVSLDSNPTFNGNTGCFATTAGTVTPLVITPTLSSQSGLAVNIFAEGLDPNGVPTTLVLNSFSANLYTTADNTDPNATQITPTEWGVGAAIGEDNPAAAPDGVSNDGTNNAIVLKYGVVGGACDGAGGVDSPFRLHIQEGHRTHGIIPTAGH